MLRTRDIVLSTVTSTQDWATRRQAVYFAVFVDRESARAARHADGIAALIDIWALVAQLEAFFESGDGVDVLPDHRAAILEMLGEADEQVRAAIDSLDDEEIATRAREVVTRWVEEWPITGERMERVSTTPLLTQVTGSDGQSVFGSVASMEETLGRIDASLANLIYDLPVQAVLLSILLIDHYLQMVDTGAIEQLLERTVVVLESMPEWADAQRDATLTAIEQMRVQTLEQVSAEREAVVQDLDRQRTATIAAVVTVVQDERSQVLADIDRMRAETLERISAERVATIDQLEQMRASTVERIEASLEQSIDHTATRVLEIADEVFWRFALLVALVVLGALAAVFYVTRTLSPR